LEKLEAQDGENKRQTQSIHHAGDARKTKRKERHEREEEEEEENLDTETSGVRSPS